MKSKYVLVTGCAGFVGSNFVKLFESKKTGYKIIGVDNLSSGKKEVISKNVIFYKEDIQDEKKMNEIFNKYKPKFVFHFAAIPGVVACEKEPIKSSGTNILGTINLLELSAKYGVTRFIFSSSASVYGNTRQVPVSESTNTPNPLGIYAAQKLAGEVLCDVYSKRYNLETVCLRYFNIYGPGQRGGTAYASVIPAWLESHFAGNDQGTITGDGKQTRDFCYVEDIANANFLAMKTKNKLTGQTINIGSGKETSIVYTRKVIENELKNKLNIKNVAARPNDIKRSVAKTTLAKKLLGFEAKTNLSNGIKQTVSWFKKEFPNQT